MSENNNYTPNVSECKFNILCFKALYTSFILITKINIWNIYFNIQSS